MFQENEESEEFKEFKEFLRQSTINSEKLYSNYFGIVRKDYPKWCGWKIINNYKEQGVEVSNINDLVLDRLVCNFYYVIWLKDRF